MCLAFSSVAFRAASSSANLFASAAFFSFSILSSSAICSAFFLISASFCAVTFSYFFAELSKKALISFRSLRFAVVLRFRISEPGSNFKLRRVFLDFTLVDF